MSTATTGRRRAFTLVEILIVVVILGILAALVVPQFSRASNDTIKSSIRHQLQIINTSVEVYRGQNFGLFPTADPVDPLVEGGANDGWGVLVSENYMKTAPVNPYTNSVLLVAGTVDDASGESRTSANGWYYDDQATSLDFAAAGYDPAADLLFHEN